MKNITATLCLIIFCVSLSFSQWTYDASGNIILSENKTVNIGTPLPTPYQHNFNVNGTLAANRFMSGYVNWKGIGTNYELRLHSSDSPTIFISKAEHNLRALYGTNFNFQTSATNTMAGGTTKMTLTNIGNLGIGITEPISKVDIRDNKELELRLYAETNKYARFWAMNSLFSFGLGVNPDGSGAIIENVNMSTPNELISFNNSKVGIGIKPNDHYALSVGGATQVSKSLCVSTFQGEPSKIELINYSQGGGSVTTIDRISLNSLSTFTFQEVSNQNVVFNPNEGKIGVGTTTPTEKLHVKGNMMLEAITNEYTGATGQPGCCVGQTKLVFKGVISDFSIQNNAYPGTNGFFITNSSTSVSKGFRLSSDGKVTIGKSLLNAVNDINLIGKVFVGESNSQKVPYGYQMAVAGGLIAEEVRVKLRSGWGDFVFDESYTPSDLEEVANYIKKEKHLPGIPSATHIDKEGVDLGEMIRLQMIKIEELTLHLIKQQEQINELQILLENK